MWMMCGDQRIPLSHTSSTFVIARTSVDLPACDARIVYTIDDARYERDVVLVNGMTRASREGMVLSRDHVSPF
jgi:hypothetical protein